MKKNSSFFRFIPLQLQLFILGILLAVPALLIIWYLYTTRRPSDELMAVFWFAYLLWSAGILFQMWRACHEPFYTLTNLVRSLHQGDYSQRLIQYPKWHAIGYLHEELNTLADVLQNNRIATIESVRRFQYLIDQLEIGVVAFDEQKKLTMINSHLSKYFGKHSSELNEKHISNLSLESLWECKSGRTLWLTFEQRTSRFLIHSSVFREDGKPHRLFLLTDVNAPLREEERFAWKRLIRVLGHELNNSLTPIISLTSSLKSRFQKLDLPEQQNESTMEALDVIRERALGMNRFVEDYSKLAKLPEPNRQISSLTEIARKLRQLMETNHFKVIEGPDCELHVDTDQITQLFINLIKNAEESVDPQSGEITMTWRRESTDAVITVDDNGPGIEKLENLFVPFFSTKPGGSGIGLVLCRQIAEVNGGSIDIQNRTSGGCRATICLPIYSDK